VGVEKRGGKERERVEKLLGYKDEGGRKRRKPKEATKKRRGTRP